MPATIGVDATVMHPQDVAAETCSGYNFIARRCLRRGWEDCLLKNSRVPNLAGANDTSLSLAGVVSLASRFGTTVYWAPSTAAEQLAVNFLLGTRFLNEHL